MKKVITTGKTVELATELALQKLGVSRDRVTISVLTQPSRGLFGLIGARDAEVEVEVIPLDPIQETRTFIDDVLRSMNLHDVTVDVVENGDNTYTFRLSGESIGILIGRRGATLD
ncbi:MAG: Jag N-terminal domain-containing protein, partial [Tumebacillaceae bacterium]